MNQLFSGDQMVHSGHRQSPLSAKFTPVANNIPQRNYHNDSWTRLVARDITDLRSKFNIVINNISSRRCSMELGTLYEIFISKWKTEICMRMRARKCARTIIQVHVLLTISNCTRIGRPAKRFCHWPFAYDYKLQYFAILLYITVP